MKIKILEDKFMQQGQGALILSTMDYNYYIRNMPMETEAEKFDEIIRVIKKELFNQLKDK